MKIIVNGVERETPEDSSVARVVSAVTALPSGVAVALNGEVVPRTDWTSTIVREADRVEVLTAVQGG
jgi:sulfur carrier protein